MNSIKNNLILKNLNFKKMQGATLVISLIFMALIVILSSVTLLNGNATVRATGDWVDRQKSINIADAALKFASKHIEDKLKTINENNTIENIMNDPNVGFYYRQIGTAPTWDPWPEKTKKINIDGLTSEYFVIYEGATQLINPGDSFGTTENDYTHWFTIFARADGRREQTQVILSSFTDFAI